jgi:hypothetical protein
MSTPITPHTANLAPVRTVVQKPPAIHRKIHIARPRDDVNCTTQDAGDIDGMLTTWASNVLSVRDRDDTPPGSDDENAHTAHASSASTRETSSPTTPCTIANSNLAPKKDFSALSAHVKGTGTGNTRDESPVDSDDSPKGSNGDSANAASGSNAHGHVGVGQGDDLICGGGK